MTVQKLKGPERHGGIRRVFQELEGSEIFPTRELTSEAATVPRMPAEGAGLPRHRGRTLGCTNLVSAWPPALQARGSKAEGPRRMLQAQGFVSQPRKPQCVGTGSGQTRPPSPGRET